MEIYANMGPFSTFSLPGGGFHPLAPVSCATKLFAFEGNPAPPSHTRDDSIAMLRDNASCFQPGLWIVEPELKIRAPAPPS